MSTKTDKISKISSDICAEIDMALTHICKFSNHIQCEKITKSELQSAYYSFSVKLLRMIGKIDGLTSSTSRSIIAFDKENDLAGVTYANSLFDLLVSLRVMLQEFLEHCEQTVKTQEIPHLTSGIKKEVDALMRKMIFAKDEFKKYL